MATGDGGKEVEDGGEGTLLRPLAALSTVGKTSSSHVATSATCDGAAMVQWSFNGHQLVMELQYIQLCVQTMNLTDILLI